MTDIADRHATDLTAALDLTHPCPTESDRTLRELLVRTTVRAAVGEAVSNALAEMMRAAVEVEPADNAIDPTPIAPGGLDLAGKFVVDGDELSFSV